MANNNPAFGVLRWAKSNFVVVVFMVISIGGFFVSGMAFPYTLEQVLLRLAQNSFLVLALIIPVIAGMGLNFSMTVGAMAAQAAAFFVTHWFIKSQLSIFDGISGLLLMMILSTPISALFGYLSGLVLNKTKGQEMITGMILGYFATGVYMLFFLILLGKIIPLENEMLLLSRGVGLKNTFELTTRGALDNLMMVTLQFAGPAFGAVMITLYCGKINRRLCAEHKKSEKLASLPLIMTVVLLSMMMLNLKLEYAMGRQTNTVLMFLTAGITLLSLAAALYRILRYGTKNVKIAWWLILAASIGIIAVMHYYGMMTPVGNREKRFVLSLLNVKVPVAAYLCVGALCLFNNFLQRTKLGQDIRTVGQNMAVATASGINVNKVRIIAIVFSTVFAGWGQLMYLQSIGVVQTYAAHTNVALYSIAAILVGGASVSRATNKQAILGVILFHTMTIILPDAIGVLFYDAQNSEHFRSFILYAVICVALVMHVFETKKNRQAAEKLLEANSK